MTKTVAIIGAGISGATAARILADNGFRAEVFEAKSHVGGNCHTERCPETGVMLHTHGPHIFHTKQRWVWGYVTRFADMVPYIQRTKAVVGRQLYSFPINLHTLSQLYGQSLTPERARMLIREETRNVCTKAPLDSMEGYLLSTVGPTIYEKFFRDYTLKQWGRHPRDLPASVGARIPVRFDHNDNAFNDPYQGIPRNGYTALIENMLDSPRITLRLNEEVNVARLSGYHHIITTGPVDEAFEYRHGYLPYRTLQIAHERLPLVDDAQGCSVINCCDAETLWTRQTEHKHFTPWEGGHPGTVVSREFSIEWQPGMTRYYPVRLAQEEKTLTAYTALAAKSVQVTFMGRLGLFQYLNMDQAVEAAIRGTQIVMREKL